MKEGTFWKDFEDGEEMSKSGTEISMARKWQRTFKADGT